MVKSFKVSNWLMLVAVAGIVGILSGCGKINDSVVDDSAPIFWQKKDDFADMDAYYLDAKVWIDRESGQFLALQFQCFRHFGAQISIDQNLIVNSGVDPNISSGSARYLDAVLFKTEGESAQVYRFGPGGQVLSTFQDAKLDLGYLLSLDENDNYRNLQLRFVYGASPLTAQIGDVGELSRADSVDFDLSTADPEVGKFLRACAPVKNWVPPK